MKKISRYQFHKTKYGDELLVDVVELRDIKKFLSCNVRHFLTYFDITLITVGEGVFKVADKIHRVQKGDVIFTLPNQPREWDTKNITNGYALIFEEEFLISFFNDPDFLSKISYFNKTLSTSAKLTLTEEEYSRILSLILDVKKEIKDYQEKDKHILRAILYQILKYLDRIFIRENENGVAKKQNYHVLKFLELVNNEFRQYHSVQYYACKLCITPNYLNEITKRETGFSAKQMINDKILSEAKKILLYTQTSIVEIAFALNFENPSYFVRFFRKQTNQTPLQYRKNSKP